MEDKEIISLYQERKEAAIEETEKKFGKLLKHMAMTILRNPQEAEECVNTTYLSIWNTIPPKEPQSQVSYLGKILRNAAIDSYRKGQAKKRSFMEELPFSELEECIPDGGDKVWEDRGEITKAINNFLRTLDIPSQQLFIRRYWYLDSIKTIATAFNISENNAKQKLFKLRNNLKGYLQEEGIFI